MGRPAKVVHVWDVLTGPGRVFIFRQSALNTLNTASSRPAAVPRLMCRSGPGPRAPFARRHRRLNMCAGILPQLRQGLARSAVGTSRVWENTASVPVSFPHRRSGLMRPPSLVPPVTLTLTVPPPLSHPRFSLSYSPFFSLFYSTTWTRLCKIYFYILHCHL